MSATPMTPRGGVPVVAGLEASAGESAQTVPPRKMIAQPPSGGRKPPAAGGASTDRAAPAAASRLGAGRGSFTAREPGVKLGLKLPAHSGEFSDAEQTRKESILKASEGECTAIESTGMYVGGEMVARNASMLRSHKITHVLNMAGVTIPNFLEADGFDYLTVYLHDGGDTAAEDFRLALPRILEWLDGALKPPSSARILVHCQAGVSRSCSAVIAYLMWARNLAYDKALALVKAHRTVASPNMAFQAALLRWEQTRHGKLAPAASAAPSAANGLQAAEMWLFRICRHQAPKKGPGILVAKQLELSAEKGADAADKPGLDPRGCFILRLAGAKLYGWVGKEVAATDPCREELQRALTRMRKFECPAKADTVVPAAATKPDAYGQTLLPPKMAHGGEMTVDTKQTVEATDSSSLPAKAAGSAKVSTTQSPELVLMQGAEPPEIARLIAESAGGLPCYREQIDASHCAVASIQTPTAPAAEAEVAAESPSLLPDVVRKETKIAVPLTARGIPPPRPGTQANEDTDTKAGRESVLQTPRQTGAVTQEVGKPVVSASAGDDDGANLIPSSKKTKPSAPSPRPANALPTAAAPPAGKTIVPSAAPSHQTPRINPETADPGQLASMMSMATPRAPQETVAAAVVATATGGTTTDDRKGGTALYHQVTPPMKDDHGSWERFDNYDEDDLWPERLFVVCVESAPSWVWVGEDHAEFATASSENSSASVGAKVCADFTAWYKSTLTTGQQAKKGGAVQVEVQDRESDEFWEAFDEGSL